MEHLLKYQLFPIAGNPELSFWEYSSLAVARLFLLAGPGKGIRRDREVRVSHKILAMDYIASVALRVPDLAHLSISNGS